MDPNPHNAAPWKPPAKVTPEELAYSLDAHHHFEAFYSTVTSNTLCPVKGGTIEFLSSGEANEKLATILEKLDLDSSEDSPCSYCYRSMFRDYPLAFPDFGPVLVEYCHKLLETKNEATTYNEQAEAQGILLGIMKLFCRMMRMSSGYGFRMLRSLYTGKRLQQLFDIIEQRKLELTDHYSQIEYIWNNGVGILVELEIIPNFQAFNSVEHLRANLLHFLDNSASRKARQFASLHRALPPVFDFENVVKNSLDRMGIEFRHYRKDVTIFEYWRGERKLQDKRTWESLDFQLHLVKGSRYTHIPGLEELFAHLLGGADSVDAEMEAKPSKKALSRAQQLTCASRGMQNMHYLLLWGNDIQCVSCNSQPVFKWPTGIPPPSTSGKAPCKFYASGLCRKGKDCTFGHTK